MKIFPVKKIIASSLASLFVLAVPATALHAQTIAASAADVGGPIPERSLTGPLMFQILAAEVAAQRGEMGNAARTYLEVARQTRDPRAAQRASEFALKARSIDIAMPAVQLWYELAPASAGAQQTMEALWLSTGKLTEAEPLLVKRLVEARKNKQVAATYQQLLRMLPGMSDKKAALAMMERISKDDQNVPEARLTLATVAMQAGDTEKAAAQARAAVQLAPTSEEIGVGAARLLAGSPATTDEAMKLLAGVIKRQPKALEAYYTLGRLQLEKGQTAAAKETLETALRQEPESPGLLLALAQVAYQGKQYPVAQGYLQKLIDLPPAVRRDNNLAYAFLGQISEDQKDYARAKAWFAKVGPGDQYISAVTRQAMAMAKLGQMEEARVLLKGVAATGNREHIALTTAEAQILREAKRFDEAFNVLDQAVQKTRNTPEFLYDHALAAERVKKLDVMEQSLRRLIELRPDAAHAYNALGYSFADRNVRLPEAKELILKAIELRPDDPHIIDSLGWVLFRMGEADKAREQLEKAMKISPEPDILVHLGEVLWVQGKQGEALKLWRDAQKREPDNESLKETLTRLKVSL